MPLTEATAVGEVIAGRLPARWLSKVVESRDGAAGAALEPGRAAAGDVVQVANNRGCSLSRIANLSVGWADAGLQGRNHAHSQDGEIDVSKHLRNLSFLDVEVLCI